VFTTTGFLVLVVAGRCSSMAAAGWVRRPGGPRTVMFLVSVLVLLAAVVVGDVVDDSVGGGGEDRESSLETWADGGGHHHGEAEDLFNWDEEEDDEEDADIAMVVGSSSRETTATGRPPTGTHVVNVESFGAKGDGHADDTQVRALHGSVVISSCGADSSSSSDNYLLVHRHLAVYVTREQRSCVHESFWS
jgi:hypothetical protein